MSPVDNPRLQAQLEEMLKQQIAQPQDLRFWRSDDEDGVIVVARNRLGISHYRPYPSWEKYFPIVQQVFHAYTNHAKPDGFQRIGLRYINDIQFDPGSVDLEDYFQIFPHLDNETLPQTFEQLQMFLIIPYNDARDGLRVQLSSISGKDDDRLTIRLDFDYFMANPGSVPLTQISDWLTEAHKHIEEVFEGSLKDSARKIFEEEA